MASAGPTPGGHRDSPLVQLFGATQLGGGRLLADGSMQPSDVAAVSRLMESVSLEELGFRPGAKQDPGSALRAMGVPSSPPRPPALPSATVTYLHMFEDERMTIGVFCFPEGTCIPLHDHPGMTVLSRRQHP